MIDIRGTLFAGIRERLHAEVTPMSSGCLVWRADRGGGYGYTYYKGKSVMVHRLAWEAENGPIPDGLTIDHVRERGCIYKRCINLGHLELVSRSENARRGSLDRWQRIREAHPGVIADPAARALHILRDEGLVVGRPGLGTFVRRPG